MGSVVAGADEAYRQVKHFRDRIPRAMHEAVEEGLKLIYDISQQNVPVQHGDLKRTGYLHNIWDEDQRDRAETDRWHHTGGVTYGDPSRKHSVHGTPIDYAVPVHERLDVFHPRGQALYLKLAVIEASFDILHRMGKEAAQELLGYLGGIAKPFGRRESVPVGQTSAQHGQQYTMKFKPERMEVLGGDLYKGMTAQGTPSWSGGMGRLHSGIRRHLRSSRTSYRLSRCRGDAREGCHPVPWIRKDANCSYDEARNVGGVQSGPREGSWGQIGIQGRRHSNSTSDGWRMDSVVPSRQSVRRHDRA